MGHVLINCNSIEDVHKDYKHIYGCRVLDTPPYI